MQIPLLLYFTTVTPPSLAFPFFSYTMKTRAFTLALLFPLAFILSACPKQPVEPAGPEQSWFKRDAPIPDIYSNTDAENLDLPAFLYLGMQDIYYWRSRVPANLNTSSFPTPDSLLNFTKVRPDDRFSAIIQDGVAYYNTLIMGTTRTPKFGFESVWVKEGEVRITRVVAGSPAASAGLKRGQRVITYDGIPMPNNSKDWKTLTDNLGMTTTIVVENNDGTRQTLSMMRTIHDEQVVPLVRTYTIAGKKVGYLVFTSFTQSAVGELETAFATLKGENVTELILDLRYNGGGSVATVGTLCSNIASQLAGTDYARITYNSRYTINNQKYTMSSRSNGLSLNRLFVITTNRTASASEMTINALRPYITVKTVGSTSYGKPVGSNIVIHKKSGYMLLPISFAYTNALGQADFVNGFAPDIPATDDITRDFGDPQESSLKAALFFIETGRAPVAFKETSRITSSAPYIFDAQVSEPVPAFILPKKQ